MNFKDFLKASQERIGLKSQASYVEFGYGQVEPNHLSAQRTAQIYAQLPAKADIDILENGQFVKYDYAANGNGIGEVNFEGPGEWMLVYNEIKLYRDHPDGSKRIADSTLVALTLMIAESRTEEKDVMVKVVVNLINKNNDE